MSGSFCSNCGASLAPGAVFCNNCGKSQSPSQSSSQVYSQPTSSYSPPPQTNYYSTNNYNANSNLDKPMTVGEYILTFILMGIPLVNLILILVWAFGSSTNTNKKNLSRAILLMGVIVGVIYAIIAIIIMLIASAAGGMNF